MSRNNPDDELRSIRGHYTKRQKSYAKTGGMFVSQDLRSFKLSRFQHSSCC
jgi:hypothetical protein